MTRFDISTLRRRGLATAWACALALAGCAPGSDLPPAPPAYAGPYLLGPTDQIRVITFGDASLSGNFTVDGSGHIAMPLLGLVKAAGLTTEQLQTDIAGDLKQGKFLNAPSVAVEVLERRPIFVLGEVQRPGRYAYEPDMTVLSAVAIAGGYTYRAEKARVEVVRQTETGHQTGQVASTAAVQPGDVITVLERHF